MATYAIGDIQGCYDSLQKLLKKIRFNPKTDTLWFTGDIVNRGPKSLKTLRFIKGLGDAAIMVLGPPAGRPRAWSTSSSTATPSS